MYIKIIMAVLFAASLVFLAQYVLNSPGIIAPAEPIGSDTPVSSSSIPVLRIPGTFLTKNGQLLSDTPLMQSKTTSEIESGFYESSSNLATYGVYYFEKAGNMTVILYDADTKQSRLDAEKYIKQTLPYTESELCAIDAMVTTNEYVNPKWSGVNLGFSFCPGSVTLP